MPRSYDIYKYRGPTEHFLAAEMNPVWSTFASDANLKSLKLALDAKGISASRETLMQSMQEVYDMDPSAREYELAAATGEVQTSVLVKRLNEALVRRLGQRLQGHSVEFDNKFMRDMRAFLANDISQVMMGLAQGTQQLEFTKIKTKAVDRLDMQRHL